MSNRDQFDYSEKRSFGARYGFVIGILFLGVIVVVIFGKMFNGGKEATPRKVQEMVMIKPAPPPPPPPPQSPPPPQDAPKEQMMEQTPVDQTDSKPEPQDTPAPALGTNVAGNGAPDAFGLSGNKGGVIGGGGNGHANTSRFGWYANQVIQSISEALGKNPRTRNASFNVKVRIWSDVAGRVTRAKLAEPTGDSAVDDAIKNEVLTGFQLKEPPPDGMPMPIVMRLKAQRPN